MLPQQYCLRWRYHHSNLQTMFSQLLEREAFCDVVLACEGKTIKAHKIVLSACSTYFDSILSQYEEKDPILIMKDVKYIDIKCLVEFMYKGEINVEHCHLATLLKTAEELRIKGLAEVSWRDEEGNAEGGTNGIQSALPHVSTVMDSPKTGEPPLKRKRGRPPIDDYEPPQVQPKIVSVSGNAEDAYSNDAMSTSDHDLSIWEEDNGGHDDGNHVEEPEIRVKTEMKSDDEGMEEQIDPIAMAEVKTEPSIKILNSSINMKTLPSVSHMTSNSSSSGSSAAPSCLTAALEKEWPDVVKMNDYLNTGRRQQFWEEPFTKRVMDGIKNKNLEMKIAAELLGVSYGTLYGRYRDAYGCLKHPYRIPNASPGGRLRDFWSEQGPTDVLLKLKRKDITLFRAAEQLNVTPQTLSNYLISMSVLDNEANQSSTQSNPTSETFEDAESDDDMDSILPDVPANSTLFKSVTSNSTGAPQRSDSVLANCPDITIIKKESTTKVNNNSAADHSDQPK